MAVVPISSLTALGAAPATTDLLVLTDVSDLVQSANGTTKKMTVANLFTAPAFTGAVTMASTLAVTGLITATGGVAIAGGTGAAGRIYKDASAGTVVFGNAGSVSDLLLTNSAGASVLAVPTGTTTAQFAGAVTVAALLTTAASASGGAGFNLPHGAAPSSPVNGDVWTTTAGLYVRVNGATVGPLS